MTGITIQALHWMIARETGQNPDQPLREGALPPPSLLCLLSTCSCSELLSRERRLLRGETLEEADNEPTKGTPLLTPLFLALFPDSCNLRSGLSVR